MAAALRLQTGAGFSGGLRPRIEPKKRAGAVERINEPAFKQTVARGSRIIQADARHFGRQFEREAMAAANRHRPPELLVQRDLAQENLRIGRLLDIDDASRPL